MSDVKPTFEQIDRAFSEIMDRYNFREDIEKALKELSFNLWENKRNPDEQVWIYKEPEYGDVIALVNWIDGEYALYMKMHQSRVGRK